MNAIIYIRFSTPKQERGDSKERQMADCLAFCERNGWVVSEIVEDLGLSAWKGDHLTTGALGKFANRVRSGEIPAGTILVCEKLDRLSRLEPRKTQRWMEDLTELGLKIATVDGGRVYDDESLRSNLMQTFEILMSGKLAHDYSNNLSGRVSNAWKNKIESGDTKLITRKLPGWMKVENGRPVLIDERVETVRLIYQMAADGLGVRAIGNKLNDRMIPTWGRADGWSPSVVNVILKSVAVEGDYLAGGNNPGRVKNAGHFIAGYYPRAVDADLVEKARAKMGERKLTGGRLRASAVNLFSGMIYCGGCRSRMYLRSVPGGRRVYQCHRAHQRRGCDRNQTFDHAAFENACLDEVLKLAMDDRFFQRPTETLALVNAVADLKKQIADLDRQAANVVAAIARMGGNEFLEADLTRVGAEKVKTVSALSETENNLAKARGWASPAEHAKRVLEIREAINDPDQTVREAARHKVMDALKGVITMVECDMEPERTFTVILVGGGHAIKFDNEGRKIAEVDITGQLRPMLVTRDGRVEDWDRLRGGLTGGDPKRGAELDAYLRRKAQRG